MSILIKQVFSNTKNLLIHFRPKSSGAILLLVIIGILFFLLIAVLEKYISWQKSEVSEAVTKM